MAPPLYTSTVTVEAAGIGAAFFFAVLLPDSGDRRRAG